VICEHVNNEISLLYEMNKIFVTCHVHLSIMRHVYVSTVQQNNILCYFSRVWNKLILNTLHVLV